MKATGITHEEVARTAPTKGRERGGFEGGAWLISTPRHFLQAIRTAKSRAGLLTATHAEETGAAPEETLAELGRRIHEVLPGSE